MSFLSVSFLLFFAILLILYYALPHKAQWVLLLAASYIFYLFAGVHYLAFLLFTTISVYLASKYIDTNQKRLQQRLKARKDSKTKEEIKQIKKESKAKSRRVMVLCIVLNFGILFFCKALLVDPLHSIFAQNQTLSFLTIALPMGMSFYMFQTIGYLIDLYRGKTEFLANPFKLALFTSFFPQLVQGPISQMNELKDSLFSEHAFDRKQIAFGLERMLWGFFKKLVIADRIAVAIGTLKGPEYTGTAYFILTVFYAVQIYADFSGGIDIAIGAAQALGVTLPENFIRPFFSKNIAEYWRRWHITLNEWMKRYIFYPITVSKPMLNLSLKSRKALGKFGMRIPVYIGSLLTWLATGIWHGFNLHFIVWGLLNCIVIVISEELAPLYKKFHAKFAFSNTRGYDAFQILRMFILMNLIRATDLFNDVGEYFTKTASLVTSVNLSVIWDGTLLNLGLQWTDYVILGGGVIVLLTVSLIQRSGSVREKLLSRPLVLRYACIIALLLVVILLGKYGPGYDAGKFIYNQF